MSIQFLGTSILFVGGSVAMDPACCCGGPEPCRDASATEVVKIADADFNALDISSCIGNQTFFGRTANWTWSGLFSPDPSHILTPDTLVAEIGMCTDDGDGNGFFPNNIFPSISLIDSDSCLWELNFGSNDFSPSWRGQKTGGGPPGVYTRVGDCATGPATMTVNQVTP